MKILIKIITIFILFFSISWILNVNAWIEWLTDKGINQWLDNVTEHSLTNIASSWDISEDIQTVWFSILKTIKYIISWVLVIFMVYTWIQMIMSMWTNEDDLTKSKTQLRYTLMWFIFINIPFQIYNMFLSDKRSIDWSIHWTFSSELSWQEENIFINTYSFDLTMNSWIVSFIEVAIFSVAVFMIIMAGLKIITSMWKDEDMTEAKNKIAWSIGWLVFIWFIESWQTFVYSGNISDWAIIFKTLEEIALFFAWPIAIFFLTLAWYYYITANWEEEKIKKAKNIIINTLIATVILLASYAFLKDLITLSI